MSPLVKTILIDKDKAEIKHLAELFHLHFPKYSLSYSTSVEDAVNQINSRKPDLVVSNIIFGDGTIFDVLEKIHYKSFSLILSSHESKYAEKAFHYSVLHYLLKPFSEMEFINTIQRFNKQNELKFNLIENGNRHEPKLQFTTDKGLCEIEINEVMRCEAHDQLTVIYRRNGEAVTVSKSLNEIAAVLTKYFFSCIQNNQLINLKYIKRYLKGKGGRIVLNNNQELEVAEDRRLEFLRKLNEYALH